MRDTPTRSLLHSSKCFSNIYFLEPSGQHRLTHSALRRRLSSRLLVVHQKCRY